MSNCSFNGGANWWPFATAPGSDPSLSWGGTFGLLVTHDSSNRYASFINCPESTDYRATISAGVLHAVPVWTPNATVGGAAEVGIIAALTNGSIEFLGSIDGGHYWSASWVGHYTPTPALGPLGAVGSTQLETPGGWPGQLAATMDGGSIFVAYSTYVKG